MIDGQNFFDQPIKNDMRTYVNIATGQGDEHSTGCLLHYSYFKENCKMIVIDLSKQQALDADSKAILQKNFTGNLARDGNTTMYFTIKEAKKTILYFS